MSVFVFEVVCARLSRFLPHPQQPLEYVPLRMYLALTAGVVLVFVTALHDRLCISKCALGVCLHLSLVIRACLSALLTSSLGGEIITSGSLVRSLSFLLFF